MLSVGKRVGCLWNWRMSGGCGSDRGCGSVVQAVVQLFVDRYQLYLRRACRCELGSTVIQCECIFYSRESIRRPGWLVNHIWHMHNTATTAAQPHHMLRWVSAPLHRHQALCQRGNSSPANHLRAISICLALYPWSPDAAASSAPALR